MIKWLKKTFTRRRSLFCGGDGCVSVTDNLGREVGVIWYRRPTSDEILNYAWQEQKMVGSESQLREVSEFKGDKAQKIHEVLVRDFWIPWAEKVFTSCTGFLDEKKETLDNKPKAKQFEFLKKYKAHLLSGMVGVAFRQEESVKKKELA